MKEVADMEIKSPAPMNLDFILEATKGVALSRHQEIFDTIGSDSRKDLRGKIFVALRGDLFDAHRFLSQATEKGAAAIIIHDGAAVTPEILNSVTVIKVSDTLIALQALATAYRHREKALTIGIAGSNGKTTSKEFTATVISPYRKVHFAKGSFNNHWGVPFTLLAQPEKTEVSVVEMGMNHKGELARLAEVADPDIVVCTYIGVEHIEHFGSLEKIAEAESEIYNHSRSTAIRIYNLDNEFTNKMYQDALKKYPKHLIRTFSSEKEADVQLKVKSVTMKSLKVEGYIGAKDIAARTSNKVKREAEIQVFGKHNVTNLMVAASAALAAGLNPDQIWTGLENCKTTWGRNQILQTKLGAEILFDGYNSNPDSMAALVENIALLENPGRKIGVFAEMRELGALASRLHEETGKKVGRAPLDLIWFYGPHAKDFERGILASKFRGEIIIQNEYNEDTANQIASFLKKGDIALVKGSRGMELERFVKLTSPIEFDY